MDIFADPNRRVHLNNREYISLGLLGKGGSSSVHRVISIQDGQLISNPNPNLKLFSPNFQILTLTFTSFYLTLVILTLKLLYFFLIPTYPSPYNSNPNFQLFSPNSTNPNP